MRDFAKAIFCAGLVAAALGDSKSFSWQASILSKTSFTLQSCDGKYSSMTGSIPGSVHTDLMNANVIKQDPYYRYDEVNQSWIPQTCWLYTSTSFDLPKEYSKNMDLYMKLSGVDSIANVYWNDVSIGQATNAHRSHTFLVPSNLLSNKNTIKVELPPTLEYAKSQASHYPYVVPETANYNVWAEPSSRNFIRKAGSDFGWDWGPAYIQTGVSGDIELYQVSNVKLEGISIESALTADLSSATLTVSAGIRVPASNINTHFSQLLFFSVYTNDQLQYRSEIKTNCQNFCIVKIGDVKISQPNLWWPIGYGNQSFYNIRVELSDGQVVSKRYGIRTVQLIQDVINATDTTFFIKVNNVPVYAKGANFIPIDSFKPRITESDHKYIIQAARSANMNMLRVWGGGVYQPDSFYDLADEYGIMIWQEVMFACALYPRNTEFLQEVTYEVQEQALRLNTHPSIVVWGGNNENEVAIGWFEPSWTNPYLYVSDYSELYGNTIYPALSSVLGANFIANKQVIWVDSSPSNGLISINPYVKEWGHASTAAKGDVHFYDYSCDCEDVNSFPKAKFISEFGFQSEPSFLAYQPVTIPEDYDWNSQLLQYRQRHEDGNGQMRDQISKHFTLPATCSENQRNFDMYLYLNTLQQGRCYETAIHRWRQLHGIDYEQHHFTMGILYWQLNDIWQGPSWSSIEWGGRWKPLQYTVKRAYENTLLAMNVQLSAEGTDSSAQEVSGEVYIVNDDYSTPAQTFTVTVEVVSLTTGQRLGLAVNSKTVTAKSGHSISVGSFAFTQSDIAAMQGCSFTTCYLRASAYGKNGQLLYTALLARPKDITWTKDPQITMSNIALQKDGSITMDVTVQKVAPFLFFEISNDASALKPNNGNIKGIYSNRYAGWFNLNNFFAEPGHVYTITYTPFVDSGVTWTVDDFKALVQGRSLQHTLYCDLPLAKAT